MSHALTVGPHRRPWRHRRDLRKILFDAQRRQCWLCGPAGPEMELGDPLSPMYATFDEVTARHNGGRVAPINQALAHAKCNHARGCAPATPEQLERLRTFRRASC